MTTTVTLTTHAWPVEATVTDDYEHDGRRTYTATTETVPPETARTFHLTSTRSVNLRELPIPHVTAEPATA